MKVKAMHLIPGLSAKLFITEDDKYYYESPGIPFLGVGPSLKEITEDQFKEMIDTNN